MDDSELVVVGGVTDVGRVREKNEDSLGYFEPPDPALLRRLGRLVLVADGMGGAAGGAFASQTVVRVVTQAYYAYAGSDPKEGLAQALIAANQAVYEHAVQHPELRGMGSTCVAMALQGGKAHIVHVGDSAVFLIRDGNILQLNDDHKKVSQMVRDGFITQAEAAAHPERNVLLRVVGAKPAMEPDVGIPPIDCRPGDRFLLCSDGLYDLVTPPEILSVVLSLPPQAAATALVNLANERGGTDNITVQVVQVGKEPAGATLVPRPAAVTPAPTIQAAPQAATGGGDRTVRLALTAAASLAILGGAVGLVVVAGGGDDRSAGAVPDASLGLDPGTDGAGHEARSPDEEAGRAAREAHDLVDEAWRVQDTDPPRAKLLCDQARAKSRLSAADEETCRGIDERAGEVREARRAAGGADAPEGPDARCRARGGTCKARGSCDGETVKRLCPGRDVCCVRGGGRGGTPARAAGSSAPASGTATGGGGRGGSTPATGGAPATAPRVTGTPPAGAATAPGGSPSPAAPAAPVTPVHPAPAAVRPPAGAEAASGGSTGSPAAGSSTAAPGPAAASSPPAGPPPATDSRAVEPPKEVDR